MNEELKIKEFTYNEFVEHVGNLFAEGKVTGEIQNEALLDSTKMSLVRMERIQKNAKIKPELIERLNEVEDLNILVITEGWCGDSSQIIPYFAKLNSELNNTSLRIVLRDENPTLMNQYLTNGSASIPKIIIRDGEKELGVLGPRPSALKKAYREFLDSNENADKNEKAIFSHKWYSKDKGETIQNDLLNLLS